MVRPSYPFSVEDLDISPFYHNKDSSPGLRLKSMADYLRLIARRPDLEIVYGNCPSTDGKTVWLGHLDTQDENCEILALGHGIHEVMHVTDTDMNVVAKSGLTPFEKLLLNVLEDVRIDALGAKKFPVYEPWRNALADILLATGRLRAVRCLEENDKEMMLAVYLHTRLMQKLDYDWAHECFPALHCAIEKHPQHFLIESAWRSAQKVFKARSTEEAAKIAQEIQRIL